MPTRRRIDVPGGGGKSGGGGGGPSPTGNLVWGPDFGEDSGSDDVTSYVRCLPPFISSFGIANTKTVRALHTMSAVDQVFVTKTVRTIPDMSAVGVANTKTVRVIPTMPSLAVENSKTVRGILTMPTIAITSTPKTVRALQTGEAEGAPLIVATYTTTLSGGTFSLTATAGQVGDMAIFCVAYANPTLGTIDSIGYDADNNGSYEQKVEIAVGGHSVTTPGVAEGRVVLTSAGQTFPLNLGAYSIGTETVGTNTNIPNGVAALILLRGASASPGPSVFGGVINTGSGNPAITSGNTNANRLYIAPVAHIHTLGNEGHTAPSGWTELIDTNNGANAVNLSVYRKYNSHTSGTVTCSQTIGTGFAAVRSVIHPTPITIA